MPAIVNDALNAARTRLNDALASRFATGGGILGNNQEFSQQMFNNAWLKGQNFLANLGYSALQERAIIFGLPQVATQDPGIEAWIDKANCTDGVNLFTSPVLPENMIQPLTLGERVTGQPCQFAPMSLWLDSFPCPVKRSYNRIWQWRGGKIYIPGATSSVDLALLYTKRLPAFEDVGNVRWFQQPIILDDTVVDALAWYLCSEVVRGDLATAMEFEAKAEDAARRFMNGDIRMKQRVNVRRRSRSGRGGIYGNGYDGVSGYI